MPCRGLTEALYTLNSPPVVSFKYDLKPRALGPMSPDLQVQPWKQALMAIPNFKCARQGAAGFLLRSLGLRGFIGCRAVGLCRV